jgi:polyketide synthase PksN
LVVSSVEELLAKLEAYVAGELEIEGVHQGQVKRNREAMSLFSTDTDLQQAVGKWIANRKIAKLLELWVKGLEVDWSRMYGETRPPRVSLPVYPFAKDRYWIDVDAVATVAARPAPQALLHPLLHRNASDLREQRYRSTFTGDEFFLTADPARPEQKLLPAVVCLEMARAAVRNALPEMLEWTMELHDVEWAQPIGAGGGDEIAIALFANGEDEVEYEIYGDGADGDSVHCRGRAVLSRGPAPAALDLAQLERQMTKGTVDAGGV